MYPAFLVVMWGPFHVIKNYVNTISGKNATQKCWQSLSWEERLVSVQHKDSCHSSPRNQEEASTSSLTPHHLPPGLQSNWNSFSPFQRGHNPTHLQAWSHHSLCLEYFLSTWGSSVLLLYLQASSWQGSPCMVFNVLVSFSRARTRCVFFTSLSIEFTQLWNEWKTE